MRSRSISAAALAALLGALLLSPFDARAKEADTPPFARVYLALRGCTSCSHCRSTIRQMTKRSAQGGETRVDGDRVEVRYDAPRPVPLREVVFALAENRLHDLSLVDVLFEARGTLASEPGGTARFTLAETGQVFRIAFAPGVERPLDGRPVRVVTVVDGWRDRGALRLLAREVRPGA